MLAHRNLEISARLEVRALERLIGALCEDIGRMICDSRSSPQHESRERVLQLEVFAERSAQALQLLEPNACESQETRISRLEKLMEAIECSRAYFLSSKTDSTLQKVAV